MNEGVVMPAMTKPMLGRPCEESHMMKLKLGQYIKNLRQTQGMAQADLARVLGMKHASAVSAIEVGRNTVPPERYLEFSEALDVPPKDFIKEVLLRTNPWAHVMLFSAAPQVEMKALTAIPDRFVRP
jgi:transcriptional regulator with XRE-family HTH domain